MLSGKTILIISPEPWNHIFVSKHHYARALALKHNKVFFLNPPTNRCSVDETGYHNVWSVHYTGFLPGLRFLPSVIIRKQIHKVFTAIEKICNVKFDVVWSFDNSVFFDFSALPDSILKITHIVDLNQNFQTHIAARTAACCFCTTDLILARLKKYNIKSFKITHGFINTETAAARAIEFPGVSTAKIVYAGNLGMPFIDWLAIQQMVTEHPSADFIFIGPNRAAAHPDARHDAAKSSVFAHSNVFDLGKIPSEELQHYLAAADVLILAYQERYHDDQANPHKMMEYLGSGKMIVASKTFEYEEIATEHFLMANHNTELPHLLTKALAELRQWNEPELQKKRRQVALQNTYEKQIERIERILSTL
ncbi:MAG TPA: glycosyltransferase [Chryseosolibacter sp.]